MGAILLIDATKPGMLERARYHLSLIQARHLPVVIAANKSDLPATGSDSEIRKALGIPANIPVFFISATRRSDVRLVVESLVDSITQVSL
jgi:signal recognition particle receptor subunit beta